METFFVQDDYRTYLSLLVEWCGRHGVAIWSYCLMPNHWHLVLRPRRDGDLSRFVGWLTPNQA